MIKPLTAPTTLKGLLLSVLLALSPAAFAEDNITFLGTQTDIADRDFRHGGSLSERLEQATTYCEAVASSTHVRKAKNEDRVRLRVQVKCLKDRVKHLSESHSRGHHKGHHGHKRHSHHHRSPLISKDEKKTLLAIIKQFKKDGGVIVTPPEVTPTSTIKGRVTTPDGAVAPNISVSVDQGATVLATTDADGRFSLALEAGLEYAIQLSADNVATQVVPAKSPVENATVNLDFTVIARGAVQSFASSRDGVLTGNDGASVAFAANSFVDSNGDLVTGDIQLTITPVDVANSASLGAFPGEFAGIQSDSTETPIISLGVVEYKFTKDGEALQLDASTGATADILIPIYIPTYQDGTAILVGDEIPLWSLNETTGIWLQEGTGTVVESEASPTGLAMQATVSHFTWWNCDVSMDAGSANVSVTGTSTGTAAIQATVLACNIGWRPTTVETVINIGETASDLSVPSSCQVCYSAQLTFDSGETASTLTQCATADPQGIVNISLQQPSEGPLDITANGSNDPVTVNGFSGYPVNRVQLASLTAEDSVTYSVSGAQQLPAGLSLNVISATQAEIVGTPTEGGDFAVTIQGIDATGAETDVATINYSIVSPSESTAPLFVNDLIYFSLDPNFETGSEATFDLSRYNVGATASSWSFEQAIDFPEVPSWFSIDPNGLVTVTRTPLGYENWTGKVNASNNAGTATTEVQICIGDCRSTPTPAPGDYVVSTSGTDAFEGDLGGGSLVEFRLNQPSPNDITFTYTTADDSAIAGQDYMAATGLITIPAGSLTAEVAISVIDDFEPEGTEQFYLFFVDPSDGVRFQSNRVTFSIYDDEVVVVD